MVHFIFIIIEIILGMKRLKILEMNGKEIYLEKFGMIDYLKDDNFDIKKLYYLAVFMISFLFSFFISKFNS